MDIHHGDAVGLRPPHPEEAGDEPITGTYVGATEEDGVRVERTFTDEQGGTMPVTHVMLVTSKEAADREPPGSWVAWPLD
jgi:hypothetical protein